MSDHKVFIANGVFPHFNSTPAKYRNFGARADTIADLVRRSGADCATFGEMGKTECLTLASELGADWQYDRAQGVVGGFSKGLNSVWSKRSVWQQPEDRISDYNMPSAGQWQRTLIICRLIEVADPTAFVGLGAFHETLGNTAKMQYTRTLVDKVGDRRVLLGGDFPRADDDDDLAYMKRSGFVVHGRTSATPMACFTKGAVKVTQTSRVTSDRAFDHDALVVSFTLLGKKSA